ncbi:hypothetical protein CSPX01_05298, partial [Colletotrichum filicis]
REVTPTFIFERQFDLLHARFSQGLQVPKHGDHVGDSNWRHWASNDISRAHTTQFWFHLMCTSKRTCSSRNSSPRDSSAQLKLVAAAQVFTAYERCVDGKIPMTRCFRDGRRVSKLMIQERSNGLT